MRLGEQGAPSAVSSHVLHEVERMAPRVLVLVNGHLVASGDTQAIRDLADRPRSIRLRTDDGRAARPPWSAPAWSSRCSSRTAR